MASGKSAEWELSKENIQPLRKGRKVDKLAQDPRSIEAERQTYESNLRFYTGPDPLKPWYDYILWLEQTFPKGGSEGGLNTLLTKCMTEFKTNPQVNQDPRYLEVWIKYANISSKPLDCYNFMYREKLCSECPGFYIAWANQLEENGQSKRAEMVYKSALSKDFTPEEKEALYHKRDQFQTRVAKKVMDDLAENTDRPPKDMDEREAFCQLKGRGKKQVVGSVRVGNAKINSGPVMLMHQALTENNASKPKFSILNENPSDEPELILPSGPSNNENLPCTPSQNRENEMSAGKWTAGRVGKKSLAVPLNQIGMKPSFEIHKDEDVEQPVFTPCKIGGTALSTKKPEKDTSVPVALFEPFDPSVRPVYCKHLIYQGLSEISFEELRAIPFIQKMKEINVVNEVMEKQRKNFEDVIKKQEELYNEKLVLLQGEILQLKEKMIKPPSGSSSQMADPSSTDVSKDGSSKVNSNDTLPITWGDDTKAFEGGSSKESSQINSPTLNIMKKMWDSPSNQSKVQDKFENIGSQQGSMKKSSVGARSESSGECKTSPIGSSSSSGTNKKPSFEIFQDNDQEEPMRPPSPLNSNKKPSFEIFQDEDPAKAVVGQAAKAQGFKIFEDTEEKDTFKALAPSGGFVAPSSKGFAPRPKPGLGDATMVVTSLEDFAEKAMVSSTPAFGKRFLPEDDENTCAVPLLFKKPVEPENINPEQPTNTTKPTQELSTIMELSIENKSSSSSSSSSACTTNGGGGVSSIQTLEAVNDFKRAHQTSSSSTLAFPPLAEKSEASGYAADINSLSKTPNPPPGKRPCQKNTPKFIIQSPIEDDEEDDDRFSEIMSTYEKALENRKAAPAPPTNEQNSFFQQSLKASFTMDRSARFADSLFQSNCDTLNHSSPKLEFSQCSPRLDNSTNENPVFSPQPDDSVNMLTDQLQGVMVASPVYDLSNPFDEKIQRDILRTNLKVPLPSRKGFIAIEQLIPKINPNKMVQVGESFFGIKECIGEGSYGKIFKAIRHNNSNMNDTIREMNLVFKVQKPSREWEFYICSEVQRRLHNYGSSFMTIPRCYSFSDGSIFVSEFLPASLLDILNATSKKMAEETFAIFFVINLCELVHRLGEAKIIHADIKPDNIMLRKKPVLNKDAGSVEEMFPSADDPCIQLIDFGRSIDMALCEEGTTFTHSFKTKNALTPEMIKGKPWSYQLDYFGIASTAYCLKFGSYMNLVERNGIFTHGGHYKRWWNTDLWSEFYQEFLNVEDVSKLPDLMCWKKRFEAVLFKKGVATDFNRIFKEIESLGYIFN